MTATAKNDSYNRIHFVTIAIESGAKRLGISGKEMHNRLQAHDLINKCLIQHYELLHTQSIEWVSEYVVDMLRNWEDSKKIQSQR